MYLKLSKKFAFNSIAWWFSGRFDALQALKHDTHHCLDFNYKDGLEVFALGHGNGLSTIMLFSGWL